MFALWSLPRTLSFEDMAWPYGLWLCLWLWWLSGAREWFWQWLWWPWRCLCSCNSSAWRGWWPSCFSCRSFVTPAASPKTRLKLDSTASRMLVGHAKETPTCQRFHCPSPEPMLICQSAWLATLATSNCPSAPETFSAETDALQKQLDDGRTQKRKESRLHILFDLVEKCPVILFSLPAAWGPIQSQQFRSSPA